MVYFIHATPTPYIKIGFTDDIDKRTRNLQSENPHELKLIGICEGDRRVERHYHSVFQKFHVRGDWFHLGPELKNFLETRFGIDISVSKDIVLS